jgi:hypothetical protein
MKFISIYSVGLAVSILLPIHSSAQQQAKEPTKTQKQIPKALKQFSSPAGKPTLNADCLIFGPMRNLDQPGANLAVTLSWDMDKCPIPNRANVTNIDSNAVKAALTMNVITHDDAIGLTDLANTNFTAVQQAVIDAIVSTLDDKSIKVDDIKAIITAASEQITADLKSFVQAEVTRQMNLKK